MNAGCARKNTVDIKTESCVTSATKRASYQMASEIYIGTTPSEWEKLLDWCQEMLADGKPKKFRCTNTQRRSLDQNAFQHVIYTEISKYLISKGRTDWTPKYTKRNLKNKFLGWELEEYVDIETGEKTSREALRSTAALDKGDAYLFTTAILEWAESIGCEIKIPSDSEYMKQREEQLGFN